MDNQPLLELEFIDSDPSVMRLLPPEIAFRYQALPIAADGERVTIAMASPADQMVFDSIRAFIESPVCFVQADPRQIDLKLNQVWPSAAQPLRITAWLSGQEPDSFVDSVEILAELYQADNEFVRIPGGRDIKSALLAAVQTGKPDLVLSSEFHPARQFNRLVGFLAAAHPEVSFLKIPPEPIRPISRILLILPGWMRGADRAVYWASRLAPATQAQVTILPVLPPLPLCYGRFLQHDLEDILTGVDPMGCKLRDISRCFQNHQVVGVYKIREGDPFSQIREEVSASDPDLIIIPAHLRKGLNGWSSEDLGATLFKLSRKSILITFQGEKRI